MSERSRKVAKPAAALGVLVTIASMGELRRMTQFKDKSAKGASKD